MFVRAGWRTSEAPTLEIAVKLDDPSVTAPILREARRNDASGDVKPCSQTSIDCWAKTPAIAPCDHATVTEGNEGVARSPAA